MSAETFYLIKGVGALIATVLLIWHMSRKWSSITTLGQRLRYLTLFYMAGLITFKSVSQVKNDDVIGWSAVAALGGVVLLVITSVVSLREDERR